MKVSNIEEVSGGFDTPSHVGAVLQRARLSAGYDLRDVAQHLRVRTAYLEAIEAGRYNDLPGRTYAIGFVRGYAELMRLDSAALVNQFKAETVGLAGRTELVFPSPPPEGRIPGGAILFVSVLVALIAYGVWYYSSVTEKGIAELVPAVPDRLAALLDSDRQPDVSAREAVAAIPRSEEPPLPAPGSAGGGTAPAAGSSAPSPSPSPSSSIPSSTPPSTSAGLPAAPVETPAPQAGDSVASSAADSAVAAGNGEDESTPEPSTASGQADPNASLTPRDRAAETAEAPPATLSSATPAPIKPAPTTMAAVPPPAAPDAAGPAAGARIVLQARDEVWVQIRDGDSAMMTRILRKGDAYRVPNRGGLMLLTGNAGALDIVVDGTVTPSLGPIGAVRRDIPLDAERLLSGVAAAR
ncbi:helix-turn-helix domain-containing protein [Oceanibaculum pacificum]|uniref:helix-turn-helix domain-containing protein n=1 Tax=Oceanibaculum pacificum TaxID=580166 RepID=UPI0018DC3FED|nr:helix-turn-helix domain-containing protein [Oceanibaculum pacificum]